MATGKQRGFSALGRGRSALDWIGQDLAVTVDGLILDPDQGAVTSDSIIIGQGSRNPTFGKTGVFVSDLEIPIGEPEVRVLRRPDRIAVGNPWLFQSAGKGVVAIKTVGGVTFGARGTMACGPGKVPVQNLGDVGAVRVSGFGAQGRRGILEVPASVLRTVSGAGTYRHEFIESLDQLDEQNRARAVGIALNEGWGGIQARYVRAFVSGALARSDIVGVIPSVAFSSRAFASGIRRYLGLFPGDKPSAAPIDCQMPDNRHHAELETWLVCSKIETHVFCLLHTPLELCPVCRNRIPLKMRILANA